MTDEARNLTEQAQLLTERARAMCDHGNHRHDYDSDGLGYTCNDCGAFGYGPCGFCLIKKVAKGTQ